MKDLSWKKRLTFSFSEVDKGRNLFLPPFNSLFPFFILVSSYPALDEICAAFGHRITPLVLPSIRSNGLILEPNLSILYACSKLEKKEISLLEEEERRLRGRIRWKCDPSVTKVESEKSSH